MKLIIDISKATQKIIHDHGEVGIHMSAEKLLEAIIDGKPLDNLRTELEDYITHSPYIKTFMDCCRLRDDVMRIIDKYNAEEKQE